MLFYLDDTHFVFRILQCVIRCFKPKETVFSLYILFSIIFLFNATVTALNATFRLRFVIF